MYRIVRSLLGPTEPEDEVEEVVQLVFIAIDGALPKFRGDSALSTWVYGIASRVVMRQLRTRRRYRAMIERFERATIVAPPGPNVEETVAERQSLELIWSILIRMPADKRVILILYELEQLPLSEVAERLNLSEEAVRSRLRRARNDLRRRYAVTTREGETRWATTS